METLNSPTINWDLAETLPNFRKMEDALILCQRTESVQAGCAFLIGKLGEELGLAASVALQEPSAAIQASRAATKAAGEAWIAEKAAAETAAQSAVAAFAALNLDQRKKLIDLIGGKVIEETVGSYGVTIVDGIVKKATQLPAAMFADRLVESSDGGFDRAVAGWIPARAITAEDIEQAERQAAGVEVVNLTPHPLTIERVDGTIAAIPGTGAVARLAVTREARPALKTVAGEFSVSTSKLGEIEGLPAPNAGKIYVVSALVADAAKRADVFSPGELIRDAEGKIIGARGMCAYV